MTYIEKKKQAITLRMKGMSYTQIQERVEVSKSTLSSWLEKYPLSQAQIYQLRDVNPRRIESFRNTMKKKRDARITLQAERVRFDIKKISTRELFIAGFFLFWGEGAKRRSGEVSLTNTDPNMIAYFIKWLILLGAKKEHMRFTLHLYKDMDSKKELIYWSKKLKFPLSAFHNPYIKNTTISEISYKNGFGHGTCNARYMSQESNDYVRMGLSQIRDLYEN